MQMIGGLTHIYQYRSTEARGRIYISFIKIVSAVRHAHSLLVNIFFFALLAVNCPYDGILAANELLAPGVLPADTHEAFQLRRFL